MTEPVKRTLDIIRVGLSPTEGETMTAARIDERARNIATALVDLADPVYLEALERNVTRLHAEKELLAYHVLRVASVARFDVLEGAAEAWYELEKVLGRLGYTRERWEAMLELGEPQVPGSQDPTGEC